MKKYNQIAVNNSECSLIRKVYRDIKYHLILFLNIIHLFKNWQIISIKYFIWLAFKNNPRTFFILRNGIKFHGTLTDINVIFEKWLIFDYEYVSGKTRIIIEKNDIVVDIGAHIGAFAVYAAKRASKGQIFAYEPAADNYNDLVHNLKINNIKNAMPFKYGIAGSPGKRNLHLDASSYNNSMIIKRSKKHDALKIECISLPQIFELNKLKKIDFLKIDCEGAEFEILFTTPKSYLNKINRISLECHEFLEKYSICDMITFLTNNSFKVYIGKNICEGVHLIYAQRQANDK